MSAFIMLSVMLVVGALAFFMFANGVSPTPTLPHVKRAVLQLLPENVTHMAELGCGWGGMSAAFLKARPAMQVSAFETSVLPYLVSLLRRKKGIKVLRQNFMQADLGGFDCFYCYLTPQHMTQLKGKLPAGAVVISAAFAVPEWEPELELKAGITPVYRYRVPA